MKNKKNSHPSVAALGREMEAVAIDTAAASTKDSTRSSGKRQDLRISDFLETGEEHARSMKYLRSILHRDSRTIRILIERERWQGIPILSNCKTGYFLAADQGEVERFTRSMRHRIGEIIKTVKAIEGSGIY